MVASRTASISSPRTKDKLLADDYITLTEAHVRKWTGDFKARNLNHICSSYMDYLKALIKATPRISKVPLQAAASTCFGVDARESSMFANAIHDAFKSIAEKARKVTSGALQDQAVLELVKHYKICHKDFQEEDLEFPPNDVQEHSALPDLPPASPWTVFNNRFNRNDDRLVDEVLCMPCSACTCSTCPYACRCTFAASLILITQVHLCSIMYTHLHPHAPLQHHSLI